MKLTANCRHTEAPRRAQDRQRKIDLNVHYDGIDSWFDYRSAYQVPVMYDDLYVMPTEPMTKGEFTLTTRWRKGEPLIDLSVLGGLVRFDATAQFGSALGTGKETLRTVYAGKGAAAERISFRPRWRRPRPSPDISLTSGIGSLMISF